MNWRFTTIPQKILKEKSILGIFQDIMKNGILLEILTSQKNGFEPFKKNLEGCFFNFEKIDNYQHGIHDYFKFPKFGFGRATDQLSYQIRRNNISEKKE